MKLPYIDLYIGDWLKDPVSGCSLAAQGLWLRLLFVMQESPVRGRLLKQNLKQTPKQNSSKLFILLEPMSEDALARRCGCDLAEFQKLMAELWEAGVPSIEDDIIYSRRMVKDEALRQKRSSSGSKGGKARVAKVCLSKTSSKTQANADDDIDADAANEVVSSDSELAIAGQARILIHFLNEKSGRSFRESSASMAPIIARLSESGIDLEGCKKVIERQCARWKGTQQEEYLRPETLFGKTKFDGYWAAKDLPAKRFTDGKLSTPAPDHQLDF